MSEGDAVSLQAVKSGGDWLLDNTQGFLVLHPDLLISGTTVVGSLFCPRRSVLSNLFRGMDSDSAVMVTGSIVHQLLQMVSIVSVVVSIDLWWSILPFLIRNDIVFQVICVLFLFIAMKVLREKKSTETEVRQLADELISSKECIRMLFSAKMSVAHMQKEFAVFIPRIVDFVEKYISKAPVAQKTKRE